MGINILFSHFFLYSFDAITLLEDIEGKAISLIGLGITSYSLGEYQKAIESYQQSLTIWQELEDIEMLANSLMSLGIVHHSLEDYQQAIKYYQKSLEITQKISNRNVEANTWLSLGYAWQKLQQEAKAKTAYENARKIYQAMGLDEDVEKCDRAIQDLDNDETNPA